jgi:ferredoxin
MACVSVCPASALYAGNDTPRLDFVEANCVQCGLCEQACPEDAIGLQSRFLFEREARNRRRVLNEEPPFHCVACGKAFATQAVIEKMQTKLASHRMFQDPAALRRLQMCGDCRVRDMFEND